MKMFSSSSATLQYNFFSNDAFFSLSLFNNRCRQCAECCESALLEMFFFEYIFWRCWSLKWGCMTIFSNESEKKIILALLLNGFMGLCAVCCSDDLIFLLLLLFAASVNSQVEFDNRIIKWSHNNIKKRVLKWIYDGASPSFIKILFIFMYKSD